MKPHRLLLCVLSLLGGRGTAWGQAPTLQCQKQLGVRNKYESNPAVIHTRHSRLLMTGYFNVANANQEMACWLLTKQGDSLCSVSYLEGVGE